jgi:hypothetical protein
VPHFGIIDLDLLNPADHVHLPYRDTGQWFPVHPHKSAPLRGYTFGNGGTRHRCTDTTRYNVLTVLHHKKVAIFIIIVIVIVMVCCLCVFCFSRYND